MWALFFTPEARDDLQKLETKARKLVFGRIEWLTLHFDAITPLALKGEWSGFFKLRVSEWRVIYKADWETKKIVVHAIGNRKKIYKKK